MATLEKVITKELRVPACPIDLHEKIELYIAQVHIKTGKILLKGDACIELLRKATQNIKVA